MATINILCFTLMMIVMFDASPIRKDVIKQLLGEITEHVEIMKDHRVLQDIPVAMIGTGHTTCVGKFFCIAGKNLEKRNEHKVKHLVALLKNFHEKRYNSTCRATNSSSTINLKEMLDNILGCTEREGIKLNKSD